MIMNRRQKLLLAAVLSGLLFPLVNCERFPGRGAPVVECEVKILSDARAVHTRLGDYVAGYLAEYSLDFKKDTIFMALEIQKYEKDERLAVSGSLTGDSVSISYGGRINVSFPVFHVQKAAPARLDKTLEQILSVIRRP
jgi:hypothetical protein